MLENDNGITIAQLKEYVKDLPEKDEYGEDFEVWMSTPDAVMVSNVVKQICRLNKGDIILEC